MGISCQSFANLAADLVMANLELILAEPKGKLGMVNIKYTDEARTTPSELEIYLGKPDGVASGLGK
ncbi:MAG: hypothetical protein CM15mP52_2320 [Candidatus Neomarinimicrobiota bacterium]|nr:MAG: hypothetical protein CM15mP52_2320 [Candidatus Neomarinimicrobiota bacterium]